jgi:benzodiazapine receptor
MNVKDRRAHSIVVLVALVLVCLAAGWFGSQFKPGTWYAGLHKPPWTPPNWLFAPVWTALYITMGVAAWLVYRKSGWKQAGPAFSVFALQLVLNAMWSLIFFGQHEPGWAFLEILVLWAAILATAVLFWRHRRSAGLLLMPYLAWVSYAASLNLSLWILNR